MINKFYNIYLFLFFLFIFTLSQIYFLTNKLKNKFLIVDFTKNRDIAYNMQLYEPNVFIVPFMRFRIKINI